MLRRRQTPKTTLRGGRFAIVASTYNRRYVDAMVRAAQAELVRSRPTCLEVIRVPGAFEIPVVAARLAKGTGPAWDAILCLGVILRGQTTHAEHIGNGVTQALIRLQIETGVPMIHEVLLLESEEQARARCLSRDHNRGTEAAQTAIEMARVMRALAAADDDVPF